MNIKQAGFTLIELVMVIVILGILAATAIPKFINLSAEAKTAAVKGVAGAVSSGFAVNSAAKAANTALGSAITGSFASNAAAIWAAATNVLQSAPIGYSASAGGSITCGTAGAGSTISVYDTTDSTSASATLICTG